MVVVPLIFATPALTFNAVITAAPGWLIVMPLFTVSVTAALPNVSDVAVAERSKVSESAVVLMLAVTAAPAVMFSPLNAVWTVPPMVRAAPVMIRTLDVP